MGEAQPIRVQELPIEPKVALHAVRRISGDRKVDRGEVNSDLMRSPRFEPDVEPRALRQQLDGMIIDPIERSVRYFVVRSRNWLKTHRHLVPALPARLDSEHKRLHVEIEADELPRLQEVRSDTFERYSDDDVIASLFAVPAA